MQHYVATRPMFIDVEVMNADTRLVIGDQASQPSPSNVARGLSSLYKEITGLNSPRDSLIYLLLKSRVCSSFFMIVSDIIFVLYVQTPSGKKQQQ